MRALSKRPGVEVTGEVPDVYDWLLRASVAVAPMRMAAAIVDLLSDPARAEALGRSGAAFARERWTWEYHFAELEKILLEASGPPAR